MRVSSTIVEPIQRIFRRKFDSIQLQEVIKRKWKLLWFGEVHIEILYLTFIRSGMVGKFAFIIKNIIKNKILIPVLSNDC